MTMAANGHSIILLGRFPGKDRVVAQALAEFFGQSIEWGLQIVGDTPITLFSELSAEQAQSISGELSKIEESAGCHFRVQVGLDKNYPNIKWDEKLPNVLPRFRKR